MCKLLQASRLASLGLPHRAFLASGTGTLNPLLCVEYSGKSRWNTWPSSLYGKKIPTDPGIPCGEEGRSGHFPISGAMAGTEGRSDILGRNDIICSKHGSPYSPNPSWGWGMGERVRRRAQVHCTVFPKWLSAAILLWKQVGTVGKVYHMPHPLYNGHTDVFSCRTRRMASPLPRAWCWDWRWPRN